MYNKTWNFLLLTTVVSFIYLLRDTHTSPGAFLKQQVTRLLVDESLTEALCKGINQDNDITESERSRASSFMKEISHYRDGNPLMEFIEGSELKDKFKDDYAVPTLKLAIPWIIFFVISVVGFTYCGISWCCRNCSCCKGSKSEKTSTSGESSVLLKTSAIIFMIGIFGAAIAGVVVSVGVSKGGNKTICSVAVLVQKLVEGSPQEEWAGLQPAIDEFIIVLGDFNNMVSALNPNLQATYTASGITANLNLAKTALQTMYNSNRLSTVNPRPDPAKGGFYVPTYIQNLGPSSTDSTETGLIQTEMEDKDGILTNSSQKTDQSIIILKASQLLFYQQLDSGRELAVNASVSVTELLGKIQKFGNDAEDVFNGIGGGLLAIFSGQIILGITSVVSIIMVSKKSEGFKKGIHSSWCSIGWFMIFGWVLSTILFPLNVILFESCQVVYRVIEEPDFYNKTFDKFLMEPEPAYQFPSTTEYLQSKLDADDNNFKMQQAKDLVYRCLYGDGDMIEQLKLTEIMGIFSDIFISLDDTATLTEAVQAVPDSIIIPKQQTLVSSYKTGLVSDATQTTEDLLTLNALTNSASNQCTQVDDTWVLNSGSCTSSSGTVFASSSAANFNLNNPTCIGYDAWGNDDITQRYTTSAFPQPGCGQTNGSPTNLHLQNFINNFVDARQDVSSIFGNVELSLSAVTTTNHNFMTSVKVLTEKFQDVRVATAISYEALWNEENGFIRNADCRFIKESTTNLLDSMCVRFLSSLFQTTIVIIIISFFGLFASLMLFCLTKKLNQKGEKNSKQVHHANNEMETKPLTQKN